MNYKNICKNYSIIVTPNGIQIWNDWNTSVENYKTENWTENIAPSTEVWLVIYTSNTLLDPHIVCLDIYHANYMQFTISHFLSYCKFLVGEVKFKFI